MSDQLTSQSRPSSGISRRTALRGAAWSASAVTVVVATPNIAAASVVVPPVASNSGSTRVQKQLNIRTTLSTGSSAVAGLTATVTLDRNSIAAASLSPAGWTRTSLQGAVATYSYVGTTSPKPASIVFNPVLTLGSNDDKTVGVTVAFSIGTQVKFDLST